MTRAISAAVLAMAMAAAHTAAASATTFEGTCEFHQGALTYAHPVGFPATRVAWTIDESGQCWGTLDHRAIAASPTAIHEHLQDDFGGCGPTSDAHGPGELVFGRGRRLRYYARHGLVLGQPFVARGAISGSAVGIAEAFTENKPSALALCAANRYTTGPIRDIFQTLGRMAG
jgi:hypothetical protein